MRTPDHMAALLLMPDGPDGPLATGCIFSPDEGGPEDGGGGDSDYVSPTTTANLMKNFAMAYSKMDFDAYEDLLHDDFKFFFLLNEGPSDFWGKQEDLISTQNLFSGNPPPNPSDATQNRGISSIEVDELDELERWEPVTASDPYYGDIPGAESAVYTVRFILHHDDGTVTVDNSQIFYAAPRQIAQEDGTTRTKWEILGQRELASD